MTIEEQDKVRNLELKTPDPVKDQEPKNDFYAEILKSYQASLQAKELSYFDKWEAQAAELPEQTQSEQQRNQEQEQDKER